jgi:hypothetical protein
MSDHADMLRDILELTDCSRGQWEPLLDALVAERDEAELLLGKTLNQDAMAALRRAEAAEAERDEALRSREEMAVSMDATEATLRGLRAALLEIAADVEAKFAEGMYEFQYAIIARAALADKEGT